MKYVIISALASAIFWLGYHVGVRNEFYFSAQNSAYLYATIEEHIPPGYVLQMMYDVEIDKIRFGKDKAFTFLGAFSPYHSLAHQQEKVRESTIGTFNFNNRFGPIEQPVRPRHKN